MALLALSTFSTEATPVCREASSWPTVQGPHPMESDTFPLWFGMFLSDKSLSLLGDTPYWNSCCNTYPLCSLMAPLSFFLENPHLPHYLHAPWFETLSWSLSPWSYLLSLSLFHPMLIVMRVSPPPLRSCQISSTAPLCYCGFCNNGRLDQVPAYCFLSLLICFTTFPPFSSDWIPFQDSHIFLKPYSLIEMTWP